MARLISAATDAGGGQRAVGGSGPVGSGLVAMKREPLATSRMACVIRSKL